jgi:hypothetical protein
MEDRGDGMLRGRRTYRGKTKRNRRARKEDWGQGDQKERKEGKG